MPIVLSFPAEAVDSYQYRTLLTAIANSPCGRLAANSAPPRLLALSRQLKSGSLSSQAKRWAMECEANFGAVKSYKHLRLAGLRKIQLYVR